MTSKERMLIALDGGVPDRLPVTTHFLMPQFLSTCLGGMSEDEFFDTCGWDPITYTTPHRPDPARGEYADPDQGEPGFLESRRVSTDDWRVQCEAITGRDHPATRYHFVTPKGSLSMVLEIGGFDQFHFFKGCTETRAEVRRCFDAAGRNGAYILCPSDNFFEGELDLVKAFADEASKCVYATTSSERRVR